MLPSWLTCEKAQIRWMFKRSLELEKTLDHDLMSELKTYAEQCPIGGGVLHLGATSMDIKDNSEVLLIRQAIDLLISRLIDGLYILVEKIEQWAELPILAFTHLQPAEPSTLGYRFAFYAQDLLRDLENIKALRQSIKGKGFTGAVGTSAAITELIGKENIAEYEKRLSDLLNLRFFEITSQTYPRKQDYFIASGLASLGSSLYKFAFDLRLLQSPPFGELAEPFAKGQVGSSAMPFKRNPIHSEKMNSLARLLAQYPRIAWDNEAHSLLERTLDNSANRRSYIPEMFLACDELLLTFLKIIKNLNVNQNRIQFNIDKFAPFSALERIMMFACKAGADRQEMHEILRNHALNAWQTIENGEDNPLIDSLLKEPRLLSYLDQEAILNLMDINAYIGDAPNRPDYLRAI